MTMRIRTLLGLLVLGAVGAVVCAAEPDVARLVGQLGSDSYAEREDAVRLLDAAGGPALPALRKAAQSDEPEVRRRAAGLVRRIERRLENTKLLSASTVRLVFKDTPIPEAVARFSEAVGGDLRLDGDAAKLAGRRITLDTGEVPYWEAFDRFCREAGLVEKPRGSARERDTVAMEQVIIFNGQVIRPSEPPDTRITLTEGKPTELPTATVGPVRIRALPPGTLVAGASRIEGEFLLGLDAAVDPRMRWEKLLGVRVHKALDDQGQELTGIVTPPAERSVRTTTSSSVVIMSGRSSQPSEDTRQAAVRLRAGAKSAKKLAEVSGTVSALVLLPAEKMLTVDDILKAAGKSTDGVAGSAVKVVEVTKEESGLIRLRAHVQPPVSEMADGTPLYFTTRVIVRGQMVGDEPAALHGAGYSLLDDKGQAYQFVDVETPSTRGGGPREVILTFLQKKGQGEPAQLEFRARRGVVIDVPFTLKDVPLP
jgi:hypothetical protein